MPDPAGILGAQPLLKDANTKNIPKDSGKGKAVTGATPAPKSASIKTIPLAKLGPVSEASGGAVPSNSTKQQIPTTLKPVPQSPPTTRPPYATSRQPQPDTTFSPVIPSDIPVHPLTRSYYDYFHLMDQIAAAMEAASEAGEKYAIIDLEYYNKVLTKVKSAKERILDKIRYDALEYIRRNNYAHEFYIPAYYHTAKKNVDITIIDIIERQKIQGVIDVVAGIATAASGIMIALIPSGGATAALAFPMVADAVLRVKAGSELAYNASLGKIAVDDVHWIRGAIDKEYRWLYDFGIASSAILAQMGAAKALAKNPLRIVETKSQFGSKPKANPNNVKVNRGQQDKHITGTNNYNQEIANGRPRSILTEDPQQLLDEFAGSGQTVTSTKERVDFGDVIGQYYDDTTGQYIDTTNGIISYDRKGSAHIVPSRPNGY